MPKPKHRNDNGRCAHCFEEWPCRSKREGRPYLPSGIQAWEHDEMLRQNLAESNRRLEVNRRVSRLAAMLDIDIQVPDFCAGIMIDTELLLSILERVSDEEVVT